MLLYVCTDNQEVAALTSLTTLPDRVSRAVVRKLNEEHRVALVRGSGGRISVRSLDRYVLHRERMRDLIRKHKPWLARVKSVLGPIGTKPLRIKGSLSRTGIYGNR